MRKLAAFTVSFALGICLAQYLLPERLLLPVAAVFFAAACLALLLPGLWRKLLQRKRRETLDRVGYLLDLHGQKSDCS